jgi:hypothetical protein
MALCKKTVFTECFLKSFTKMSALSIPEGFDLILGSSSKSRASILNIAQIPYKVVVAPIDEKAIGDRGDEADPSGLVLLYV